MLYIIVNSHLYKVIARAQFPGSALLRHVSKSIGSKERQCCSRISVLHSNPTLTLDTEERSAPREKLSPMAANIDAAYSNA
jgi:hypothetical protein